MLHEIGHVVHRHSLQQVIHSAANTVVGWLSTHPETKARIQHAKDYSQQFTRIKH